MKPKNARRWLVRNRIKIIVNGTTGITPPDNNVTRMYKRCLRVIKNDSGKNEASKRLFNQLYIAKS